MTDQKIYLDQSGLWRQPPPVFIGQAEEFLKELAADLPSFFYGAAKLPNNPFPVHLAVRKNQVRAFFRISTLKLTTVFRPVIGVNEKYCYPVWQASTSTDFSASFIWKPSIAIWFVSVFNQAHPFAYPDIMDSSFLIAVSPIQAGFFRLPLANIYGDGKICFESGRNYYGPTTHLPLLERLPVILSKLNDSPWVADQLIHEHSPEDTQSIIRFSLEGETLTIPTGWEDRCKKVNLVQYNDLPLHALTNNNL